MNQITIIGRIGQEPKSKTFDNGGSICQISVAVNESYKNKSGERVDDTQWFTVTGSGPQAEFMAKYLKKGSRIAVTGKMRSRSYEKDGEKREFWELRASNFEFLDTKNPGDTANEVAAPPSNMTEVPPANDNRFEDTDLPF